MSNNNTEMFAFGENTFEDCGCPAMKAGINPLNNISLLSAVEVYDDYMQEMEGRGEGVTDEETAKEAWMFAIEETDSDSFYDEFAHKEALLVAEKLGWVNDN